MCAPPACLATTPRTPHLPSPPHSPPLTAARHEWGGGRKRGANTEHGVRGGGARGRALLRTHCGGPERQGRATTTLTVALHVAWRTAAAAQCQPRRHNHKHHNRAWPHTMRCLPRLHPRHRPRTLMYHVAAARHAHSHGQHSRGAAHTTDVCAASASITADRSHTHHTCRRPPRAPVRAPPPHPRGGGAARAGTTALPRRMPPLVAGGWVWGVLPAARMRLHGVVRAWGHRRVAARCLHAHEWAAPLVCGRPPAHMRAIRLSVAPREWCCEVARHPAARLRNARLEQRALYARTHTQSHLCTGTNATACAHTLEWRT